MNPRLPAGGLLRWWRAFALAIVAFTVSASAHVLAHGHAPGPAGSMVLMALMTLAIAPALGRELSRRRLIVVLAAAEVAVHVGMTVLARVAMPVHPAIMRATASRLDVLAAQQPLAHHGAAATVDVGIPPSMASLPPGAETLLGSLLPDPTMLVAHLISVLVLGFLLAHSEASLWSLLALRASMALQGVRRWLQTLPVAGLITASRPPASPPCLRRQGPASFIQRFADALSRPSPTDHRGPPCQLGALSA